MRELVYRFYWHCPLLFSGNNYFGTADNVYQGVVVINMLGMPNELEFDVVGMTEVGAANKHILQRVRPMSSLGSATEEEPLSDQEIEEILLAENGISMEETAQVPTPHLVESASAVASWGKWLWWLSIISMGSEFLVGWLRR